MLSDILSGLKGVVSYLDDIIIVGKTEAKHWENVINVIQSIHIVKMPPPNDLTTLRSLFIIYSIDATATSSIWQIAG